MAKILRVKENRTGRDATKQARKTPLGNPADFPIGSPESRAAARAMFEAMKPPPLSQDDADCLTLSRCFAAFDRKGNDALTSSKAFERGRELWEKRNPDKPFYDGPEEVKAREAEEPSANLRLAKLIFKMLRDGRQPEPGDVWTFEEYKVGMEAFDIWQAKGLRKLWERQMPGRPFPKTMPRNHRSDWEQLEELATGKKSCANQAEYDKWKPIPLMFTENGLAVASEQV